MNIVDKKSERKKAVIEFDFEGSEEDEEEEEEEEEGEKEEEEEGGEGVPSSQWACVIRFCVLKLRLLPTGQINCSIAEFVKNIALHRRSSPLTVVHHQPLSFIMIHRRSSPSAVVHHDSASFITIRCRSS